MTEPEIMLSVFPPKAPGNFQKELITFTMAYTRTKFSEAKLQELYSYLPNPKKSPLLRCFGLRTNAVFGNMHAHEQFPPYTQDDEKPIHIICHGCDGVK
jgi:hypothetical protein